MDVTLQTYNEPPRDTWSDLVRRPSLDQNDLGGLIDEVFDKIAVSGDVALKEYTSKFDGIELSEIKY